MPYKKSVCHLRWGYPNISLTRSEIRTCCKTSFQTVSEQDMDWYKIDLFLNTDYQKQRRLEMLKGERHHDCHQCWEIEDQGATSLRNSYHGFIDFASERNMFDEFPDKSMEYITENVTIDSEILRTNRPFMLEVSLGNTCDLKCMYCNHVYSSQWATESLKNKKISIEDYSKVTGKPDQKFINLFWEWFNKEAKFSLDRIGIIGGEPLITPEFYDFLEKLLVAYEDIPKDDTVIWIVTNLNTPESYFKRFIEYIPRLKEKFKLEILISMESTEGQAEYIRNGLDWYRFERNVNRLFAATKDQPRVELGFLPSITALSIPRFTKFLQWVHNVSLSNGKAVMLKQNIVTWPTCHVPFVLPNEFAKYLDEAVAWLESVQDTMPAFNDEYGRWNSYTEFLKTLRDGIRNNTKDMTGMRHQFYTWFKDFDQLRGLDFVGTFPEFKEFYEQCKHNE